MTAALDTIGWHRHGSSWVIGVRPRDGCGLCDLAERWLEKENEWRTSANAEIKLRKLAALPPEPAPVVVPVEVTINQHGVVPETYTVEMTFKHAPVMTVPDNEIEERPPPKPPEPTTFKLTNPDQYTIKKRRKR